MRYFDKNIFIGTQYTISTQLVNVVLANGLAPNVKRVYQKMYTTMFKHVLMVTA